MLILWQALIHGLNRHYYSIAINYRKNELEEKMLLNLHKKKWTDGFVLRPFDVHSKTNEQIVQVCAIHLEIYVVHFVLKLRKVHCSHYLRKASRFNKKSPLKRLDAKKDECNIYETQPSLCVSHPERKLFEELGLN